MKIWKFDGLWQENGWLEPAFVHTDDAGRVVAISAQPPQSAEVTIESVAGYAIPGLVNAHSHAFQYAMAGLAEHLRTNSDDFWSWREAMYGLALDITPDQMEAIATMLYSEMLRHGYTAVVEFHYLHHDCDGKPYSQRALMAQALLAAARTAGIAITLVPIYYRTGGFGRAAEPRQRRFLSASLDDFFDLFHAIESSVEKVPRAALGIGAHSLRAAPPEEIKALFAAVRADLPRHLHIAEQEREVVDCLAALGQRPVRWLLENLPIDARFNLVHATHVSADECSDLARSGATVVLCPSTEGNLGDGFFPMRDFRLEGGSWAIGSDSHIGLSPTEELRWLDYGQRLRLKKRNTLCRRSGEDSGALAYGQCLLGGRRAAGNHETRFFAVGSPFDAVIIDAAFPLMRHTSPERRMATLVYAGDSSALVGTISGGTWTVRAGRHAAIESITHRFDQAMRVLANR